MPQPIETKESKNAPVLNFFDLTQCPENVVFHILLLSQLSDIPNLFSTSKKIKKFDTDYFWEQRTKLDFSEYKKGNLRPKEVYQIYHSIFNNRSQYYKSPTTNNVDNRGYINYAKLFLE